MMPIIPRRSFRRLLLSALTLLTTFAATFVTPPVARAQAPIVWIRTYPERTQPGCTWIVAQWSDNTYSASAWECDPGQTAVRDDGARATRGYAQVAANGCTEYVSLWSDGSYSWLPFTCPAGLLYSKEQSRGVQPSRVAPPAAPPVAPPAPALPYRGAGVSYIQNCGLTQLKIYVRDAAGNPVNDAVARVEWDGISDPPITTNPTGRPGSYEAGWTDAILSGRGMISNVWRTWLIDGAGNRISDVVTFQTDNDCETANGKQIVTVTFEANRG